MIHNDYIANLEGNMRQWGSNPAAFRDPRVEAQLHRDQLQMRNQMRERRYERRATLNNGN